MKPLRIFVCSPLRGPSGLPDPSNIALAKRLMRAVFDGGHAPFVPHLLYPQVLTERPEDLRIAFEANYAFLDVCDEIWVYAQDFESCSRGMAAECGYAHDLMVNGQPMPVRFLPKPFREIAALEAQVRDDATQAAMPRACANCGEVKVLGTSDRCMDCFAGVSRR